MIKKKYISLLLVLLAMYGCNRSGKQAPILSENEYYVCSMDPQVMEKQPGACPICKMPLTKTFVDKNAKGIKLSNEQIKLANISTLLLDSAMISGQKLLTGVFAIPPGNIHQVSARLAGRIEKMYFKVSGEPVKAGEMLYELYSKELYQAQKEYLLTLDKSALLKKEFGETEQWVSAAKNKLLLWGMTPKQVEQLANSRKAEVTVPVYAPESGIVSSIALSEGDYVQEGTVVYEITDLNTLWVEARLYNQEAAGIEQGDAVNIIPTAFPDENINGKVAFINPELQEGSQYSLLRINVSNNVLKFRPGMQAYVQITSAATKGIALPTDALIRYAHSTIAWVRTSNNSFEPRLVQTGITAQGISEITAGLFVGDNVVITGAYLLNSEFTFKRGIAPTPAEGHQDMKM